MGAYLLHPSALKQYSCFHESRKGRNSITGSDKHVYTFLVRATPIFHKSRSKHASVKLTTTAFSMGIDYPEKHNVIYCGSPATVEQYDQETGRAGRSGAFASALLYGKPGST